MKTNLGVAVRFYLTPKEDQGMYQHSIMAFTFSVFSFLFLFMLFVFVFSLIFPPLPPPPLVITGKRLKNVQSLCQLRPLGERGRGTEKKTDLN